MEYMYMYIISIYVYGDNRDEKAQKTEKLGQFWNVKPNFSNLTILGSYLLAIFIASYEKLASFYHLYSKSTLSVPYPRADVFALMQSTHIVSCAGYAS